MALNIHASKTYAFEGPYLNTEGLKNTSGVYVITTYNPSTQLYLIVDVGESDDIKKRIENHDRETSWHNHKIRDLFVSAYYCDEPSRMLIEHDIRAVHNPPCGDR